jgi:hypothetical protein
MVGEIFKKCGSICFLRIFLSVFFSQTKPVNSARTIDNDREKIPSSRPSSDSSFNQSDQMSILSNITRDSFGTLMK